jgi:hypothetical protein
MGFLGRRLGRRCNEGDGAEREDPQGTAQPLHRAHWARLTIPRVLRGQGGCLREDRHLVEEIECNGADAALHD